MILGPFKKMTFGGQDPLTKVIMVQELGGRGAIPIPQHVG
jgi:hypothetical protein